MAERSSEEEYFAKIDREKREALRAELEKEMSAASREERRAMYLHRCGHCGAAMQTRAFRGADIQVCTECGSVLLDKGELEALAGRDQSGVFAGLIELFKGGARPE